MNLALTPVFSGASHPILAVLWTAADVQEARPDLSPRQAWEVFKFAIGEQDARIGVTWELLMYAAEALFGSASAWRPA